MLRIRPCHHHVAFGFLTFLVFAHSVSHARLADEPEVAASHSRSLHKSTILAKKMEAELVSVIDRVTPAFVFVGGGSGVCVSEDGYILTNYHVAGRRRKWIVRLHGKKRLYRAYVMGNDPVGDVTLLRIPNATGLPHVGLADRSELRVGQRVLALGDPFKLGDMDGGPSVSLGTLSALHRYQGCIGKLLPHGLYPDALQTDAAVNPGNSGGPLLDLEGRLLGITGQIMARFSPKANSGIAYAIPCDQLRRFLPLLKKAQGGNVHHADIPVGMHLDRSPSTSRNAVVRIAAESQAKEAGFRTGDRVLRVEDRIITGAHQFISVIQSWPEGSKPAIEVERGDERKTIRVPLPRLKAMPGD